MTCMNTLLYIKCIGVSLWFWFMKCIWVSLWFWFQCVWLYGHLYLLQVWGTFGCCIHGQTIWCKVKVLHLEMWQVHPSSSRFILWYIYIALFSASADSLCCSQMQLNDWLQLYTVFWISTEAVYLQCVWLLHGWCLKKILPSQCMFCVHQATKFFPSIQSTTFPLPPPPHNHPSSTNTHLIHSSFVFFIHLCVCACVCVFPYKTLCKLFW